MAIITQAQVEQVVTVWQEQLERIEALRAELPMTEEEEQMGDLFSGVLPALRLHQAHGLTDCLACGGSVNAAQLAERIELCEMYITQTVQSKKIRKRLNEAIKAAKDAEDRATFLSEHIGEEDTGNPSGWPYPCVSVDRWAEDAIFLERGWSQKQLSLMGKNSRKSILQAGFSPRFFSVMPDGTLFDVQAQKSWSASHPDWKW